MVERWVIFGTAEGGGNPAAVVHLERAADDATLQSRARDLDQPVCAFVQSGALPRVKFFTRVAELPFCGHGALAAGASLLGGASASSVTFQSGAQTVWVERRSELVVLTAEHASVRDEVADADALYASLGVPAGRVRGTRVASIGSPKAIVALRGLDELQALRLDAQALSAWSRAQKVNGAYAYATDSAGRFYARAFNPLGGTPEDAATGVAAGALVWALEHPYDAWLTVLQVPANASPCELHARRLANGKTEVGGRARRIC